MERSNKDFCFWFLTIATTLRLSIHGAIFVHMIPILVWKGISASTAAWYVGFLALVGVPVILIMGRLSDKLEDLKNACRMLFCIWIVIAFS